MLSQQDKQALIKLFQNNDNDYFKISINQMIEKMGSVADLALLLKQFQNLPAEYMEELAATDLDLNLSSILKDKFLDIMRHEIDPHIIVAINDIIQEFETLNQKRVIEKKDINLLKKEATHCMDRISRDLKKRMQGKASQSKQFPQLPPRGKRVTYPTGSHKVDKPQEDKPFVGFFPRENQHNLSPVPYARFENPESNNVVVRVLRHPGLSSIFTGFSKLLDRVKIEYHKVQETRSTSQKIKHHLKHEHKAEQARKKAEKRADSVILNNIAKALEQIKHKIKEQAKQTIKDIENAKDKAEVENILKKFKAFVEKQSGNLPHINIPKLDISKLGPAVAKALDKISTYSKEFQDAVDKTSKKHYEKLDQLEIKKGLIYIDGKFQSANCHQLLGTITAKLNEDNGDGHLIREITANTGGFHSDIKFKLIPLDNMFTLKAEIHPQGTPAVTVDVIKINANDMTYPSKEQYKLDLSDDIYNRDISSLVAIQTYIFQEILGKTSKSTLKIENATDKQFIKPLRQLITDAGNPYEKEKVKFKIADTTSVHDLEEIKQQLHDHNARVNAKSSGTTQDVMKPQQDRANPLKPPLRLPQNKRK